MKITLQFDDIIYSLQKSGGASVYWREVTQRVKLHKQFDVLHTTASRNQRFVPVHTRGDVFHTSYFRLGIGRARRVITVHDLTYELGYLSGAKRLAGNMINILERHLAIAAADAIICVSQNTLNDLKKIYPREVNTKPIYYIYHGISVNRKYNLIDTYTARIHELSSRTTNKFVLYVGSRRAYKNFSSVQIAFAQSALPGMGYWLVCVGIDFDEHEMKLSQKLGIQNRVANVQMASDDELAWLYQHAHALAYPSLYEGFGIPPLEAMAYGCPVIVANMSSLPEVVGTAGILINPHDPSEISTALENLLNTSTRDTWSHAGIARAQLFNWDKSAQQHIEVYQSLVGAS